MTVSFSILVFLIVVALLFDFLNGLHDAANSIATVVATRVLSPVVAVVWAAFFNFTAYFVFGTAVAKTVGAGIVSADIIDPRVIFGALCGAIAWNVITWVKGIPSSSRLGIPATAGNRLPSSPTRSSPGTGRSTKGSRSPRTSRRAPCGTAAGPTT